MRNLITDVPGVLVATPRTCVPPPRDRRDLRAGRRRQHIDAGGAPGDRMGTSLEPEMVGEMIDAVVLSGGSVYGLDAAGGASAVLCQRGQGRTFGGLAIPVAVQAILFDLINGGEKDWMREP